MRWEFRCQEQPHRMLVGVYREGKPVGYLDVEKQVWPELANALCFGLTGFRLDPNSLLVQGPDGAVVFVTKE